ELAGAGSLLPATLLHRPDGAANALPGIPAPIRATLRLRATNRLWATGQQWATGQLRATDWLRAVLWPAGNDRDGPARSEDRRLASAGRHAGTDAVPLHADSGLRPGRSGRHADAARPHAAADAPDGAAGPGAWGPAVQSAQPIARPAAAAHGHGSAAVASHGHARPAAAAARPLGLPGASLHAQPARLLHVGRNHGGRTRPRQSAISGSVSNRRMGEG